MRKYFLFSSLFLLILCFACNTEQSVKQLNPWDADRPHDPWVFRSVLDSQARMITLALHDDLWVAYSAEHGSLYKMWKGRVEFDGAVYTTAHGPQPLAVGDAWIANETQEPWLLKVNGKDVKPEVHYRGHRFVGTRAALMYDLKHGNTNIRVTESPEHVSNKSGLTGFERIFTTANVPEGVEVWLETNVGSIAVSESIKTDGTFEVTNTTPMQNGSISGLNVNGRLGLKSNGETTFSGFFVKKPLIADPYKTDQAEEEEEMPLGYRLIARNDCKTCHNWNRKTIGPAYVDVAKKYRNTEQNVALLSSKVKNGGFGVWGEQVMNAHPDVSDSDIKAMVEYVMSLDKEEEAAAGPIAEDLAPEDLDYVYGNKDLTQTDIFPGIVAKVYQSPTPLNKLADVNTKVKPTFAGLLPQVHAESGDMKGLESHFAIIYEGYLNIKEAANYQFRLRSDDGSRLNIGDKVIIDNDGLHGAEDKDGSIALEKGYHRIKVEFFQGMGGKSVVLMWRTSNAASYEVVPSTAFVHHVNDRPAKGATLPMATDRRIPGDGSALAEVHPSYDLSQARPMTFTPKVGGLDFLSDGRLVVSTWDAAGSVFIVTGAQSGNPSEMSTKLIAKGFAEPLGLKVVDDEIYVLQKQELTKLIDNNGDDIIDEYQTVCNDWRVSANFHEFAFGLAYKDGHFYASLATAINPGGASTQPQIPDRGKAVKISKADGSLEFVAQGLRTPNGVGLGVDNEVFIADNQGDWLPASKIVHVKKGAWYGSRSVDFEGTANLTEMKPVVWLPQDEIGNSPSMPLAMKDGPYKGQMIHGEVTHGGIKRVFVEKIKGEYQGCLFRFTQGLEAGVNRLCWGPDGALYVGGIGSGGNWQHDGTLWYGLQRLKYNEKPTFEMLAVRARSNGMEIEFTEPLREGDGWNLADYNVTQWWYKPTIEYGGPKLDEKSLPIKSINISDDRKKVFLELNGMEPNHVVHIQLMNHMISANGNGLWTTEAWYTLNQIPDGQPGFVKNQATVVPPNTLSASEKAAGWKLLFDGKTTAGWRNFKKQTIGSSWVVEDGALVLETVKKPEGGFAAKDGGDIITDEEFENFELELEWKISNCGNSGIMYNVVEDDKYHSVWQTGPEMQVLDNSCHPDAQYVTHKAGDLYDMIECKYLTVNPAGQWNKVRIVINNGHLEHWLNGHKIVETQMWGDEWKDMVAKSKFKDMPDFGTSRKGHISLQDHSDRVSYRNIKIKVLDKES